MENKEIRRRSFSVAAVGAALALTLSTQTVMASQTSTGVSATTAAQTQEQTTGSVQETRKTENATLSFNETSFYVSTDSDIEITLNVSCSAMPDEYNIILEYDEARLEYVSGADDCVKGKIILRGTADAQNMTYTIALHTLCNGNGGIYVKNAYITSADGSGEMKVSEKPEAVIAIVGSETTDQPDFEVEQKNFGIDTEIPLVGKVSGKDGSSSYIVDLSCFKPDSVDFNYTLTGDIYNDILITTLCSEDKSVQLAYLLDEDKNLKLCAYNNGKFYPVTEDGGNYYISPYGIAEWPDGLTDEIVDQEGIIYILNAQGKGVFVKYLKGEIVNWDYKSEIAIEPTEEEEPFYNFRNEENKITGSSIWSGLTSHIELSLLILVAIVLLIRWLIRFGRNFGKKSKARNYRDSLPPEVPYDENMAEQERIAREAEFEEIRKDNEKKEAAQNSISAKPSTFTMETEEVVPENQNAAAFYENDGNTFAEVTEEDSGKSRQKDSEAPAASKSVKHSAADSAHAPADNRAGKVNHKQTAGSADGQEKRKAAEGERRRTKASGTSERPLQTKKAVSGTSERPLQTKKAVSGGRTANNSEQRQSMRKRSADEMEQIVENKIRTAKAARPSSGSKVGRVFVENPDDITGAVIERDELQVDLSAIKKKKASAKKNTEKRAENVNSTGSKHTSSGKKTTAGKKGEERKNSKKGTSSRNAAHRSNKDAGDGMIELRVPDNLQVKSPATGDKFVEELQDAFDELKAELAFEETGQVDFSDLDKFFDDDK